LFVNFGCVILDPAEVRIGDDVFLAPYVQLATATHPVDPDERVRGRELARPIRIGNRVWLGAGAIVCPGVTIGDGSTIGAGSVVVRDIPAHVVAAGNPCRVLRSLR
jgi:maltose O-acetyltransferase